MAYLTEYYKNKCEKLAKKIKDLESQLNEEKRQYDPAASPLLVSTRLPDDPAIGDPHKLYGSKRVVVGMDAMEPEQKIRMGKMLKSNIAPSSSDAGVYHTILGPTENLGDEEAVELLGQRAKRNIEWSLDRAQSLPELAQRSQQWYVGANKISEHIGKRYGHDTHIVAGVMASLSPQKDWYQNASLGERLIHIHKEHQNTPWSPEMEKISEKVFKETDPEHQEGLQKIRGKTLAEVEDPTHAAMWIRAFDEAHHPRHYRSITPEGNFGEHVVTQGKKRATAAWGSFGEIGNAVKILRSNGDMETISKSLGTGHKVRSFYNNIVQPNNPDRPDVTGDTHHIGVANADFTLAAKHPVVGRGLGGSPTSKKTGLKGTYPVYKDVTVAVAQERGMIPNAVQSVVWDEKRSANVGTAQKKEIQDVHSAMRAGTMSHEQLLKRLEKIHGPVKPTTWMSAKPLPLSMRGSTFLESLKQKISKMLNESKKL
jgi:hypothetical protein